VLTDGPRGFEPPSGIAEARLDVAPERDRRLAKPGAVRIPPRCASANNGARQPPSGLEEAPLDVAPEQDRHTAQPGAFESLPRSASANNGARQPPSETGDWRSQARSNPASVSRCP